MTSRYDDETLRSFREADPKEKLSILRSEMFTPISVVRGYAALMRKLDLRSIQGLPEDFEDWINRIAQAGDELLETLNVIVGPSDQ